ncbi:hypothetical protein ASG03_03435 [Rhizobium sp. Leaf341]|nr:hypothetical protein ASG03_03435 [Rhizobium sp. Leaf341]
MNKRRVIAEARTTRAINIIKSVSAKPKRPVQPLCLVKQGKFCKICDIAGFSGLANEAGATDNHHLHGKKALTVQTLIMPQAMPNGEVHVVALKANKMRRGVDMNVDLWVPLVKPAQTRDKPL